MAFRVPCCVPGCYGTKSSRHRFPNPTKDVGRFNQWMEVVGNEKLFNLDSMRVYNTYRVCGNHFTIHDKSTNLCLNRTAIPSQELLFSGNPCSGMLPSTSTMEVQYTVEESVNITKDMDKESVPQVVPVAPINNSHSSNTLLRSVGLHKSTELTPRAKHLYKQGRMLQRYDKGAK